MPLRTSKIQMHEHDLELIAAYASGWEDSDRARELVESCPTCRAEFENQVQVRQALQSTAAPALTQLEGARLRAQVWREISPGTSSKPVAGWYRFSWVAAVLVVGVGLTAAMMSSGLMGSGDADLSERDETASLSATEAPAMSTAAATAEDSQEYAAADPVFEFEQAAEQIREEGLVEDGAAGLRSAEDQACVSDAGLEDHVAGGRIDIPPEYIWAFPDRHEDVGPVPIAFVDPVNCELVHLAD